jgi:hypothetical protein
MDWTKLRDCQYGGSVSSYAQRALRRLSEGALIKIEMEVNGLSKRQAEHKEETEQNSLSSRGRVCSTCFAQQITLSSRFLDEKVTTHRAEGQQP